MADTGYRLIKLNNGDNLIAKVNRISNNVMVVSEPFVYKTMSVFSPNGIKNIVLLKKWFELSSENKFEIAINSISSITLPNEKILSLYEKEKQRKQSPYMSNDELYQNQNLMNMMEEGNNSPESKSPKPFPENIQGLINLSIKITPKMLETSEGLEHLLRALGVPIDELMEEFNSQYENDDDEEESESNDKKPPKNNFGNILDDWSSDPNDYLK